METPYKYKIIEGLQDEYTQYIKCDGFGLHIPGQKVSFNNKSYEVTGMPYKKANDEFYTIELKQISN